MDFFDIGPGELLLVAFIALLIWGPHRMVEIARNVGKTIHSFRKSASEFTSEMSREVDAAKKAVNKVSSGFASEVAREVDATKKAINLDEHKRAESPAPSHLPPPPNRDSEKVDGTAAKAD